MGWLDLVDHRMSPAPTLFYSLDRRALCGNLESANSQALPTKAAMTPILNDTSPRATNLAARGLRTAADLALTRQHGDRLRYLAGCHCSECRGANTAYERTRSAARKAGDWNGIVPADKARAHLAALSAKNVGRRSVGDVSGVANTLLVDIIAGRKGNIRARTERAILAVTDAAAADHALIAAGPTWGLIDELIAGGYSKAELAQHLGYKTRALQFNRDWVTVRNAYDVQRMHALLRTCGAGPTLKLFDELRQEGFRQPQILARINALATQEGSPTPDLTVRKGRIRLDAAQLVQRTYALMTA
jgi:hypothetical protein